MSKNNQITKTKLAIIIVIATIAIIGLLVDVHFQNMRGIEAHEKVCDVVFDAVLSKEARYDDYPECRTEWFKNLP